MFRLTSFSFSVPLPSQQVNPVVSIRKGFATLPIAGDLSSSVSAIPAQSGSISVVGSASAFSSSSSATFTTSDKLTF